MSRRLEVELTSKRDDGTWTWRAAGAKQPKGELEGSLLPSSSGVGDVLRVDAEFDIEGIRITNVLPPQKERREPERLQIIGPTRREGGVSASLVAKSGRDGDRDRPRGRKGPGGGGRDDGPRSGRGRDRERREGGDRPSRDRPARERSRDRDRERAPRDDRGHTDSRPKAKRLKAGRKHRSAALGALPPEQRPLAEQLLRGGVPGVRQTIERLNTTAKADGRPAIDPERLVTLAEKVLPPLRAAEWRDRADAAKSQIDQIDLGDLRSVVNAADTWARDEESRAIADELREALPKRVEKEHHDWLDEITVTLADGRLVRALRLSSRPPKAGSPLPPEVASRLVDAASSGLTAETGQERYAAVVEALALSPVHLQVTPQGVPAKPGDALLGAVRKHAKQLPQLASLFGIEAPAPGGRKPRPARSRASAAPASGARPVPPPPTPPIPAPPTPPATAATPAPAPADAPAPAAPPAPEQVPAAAPAPADQAAPDQTATAQAATPPAPTEAPAEAPAVTDVATTDVATTDVAASDEAAAADQAEPTAPAAPDPSPAEDRP